MNLDTTTDRRAFMAYFTSIGLGATLLPGVLWAHAGQAQQGTPITKEMIAAAEQMAGIELTDDERTGIAQGLASNRANYQRMHAAPLNSSIWPAYVFDPVPPGAKMPEIKPAKMIREKVAVMARPTSLDELAYAGVAALSEMVRTRKVKPSELTEMYLARLKKYDPQLHFVITLTEERARAQARDLDAEIGRGKYRGPLHGIPWGAKDLLAVKGYPTTWGAGLYKDQSFDYDATVVKKLDDAGAILIAKLTLGALAQGDIWFGERTRNPWAPTEGSSGSSAGPGSAVASGCVPFALGTETNGSITSPSSTCGISGHRPTFGRVPRTGGMVLAWTMDKIGPMTRSAEDCALVFNVIQGPDTFDQAVKDVPFNWNASLPLSSLRIAYVEPQLQRTSQTDSTMIRPPVNDNVKAAVAALEAQGAKVKMIPPLPTANQYAGVILDAECAAAFQPDTLTDKIKELETPRDFLGRPGGYSTWPSTFRRGQFVPAPEYINAMRARTLLMQQYGDVFKDVDVVILTNENTSVTNLTGTPCITVPTALTVPPAQGGRGGGGRAGAGADTANRAPAPPPRPARPSQVRFLGGLYRDDHILRAAHAFQHATNFHREKPPLFP
jgi:Asp-tRNA(Asn)/Glu-tRNA(Gln) amidotransferase A subunit family amidase